MNFLDLFTSQLGANHMDALSGAVGANQSQTNSAIGAIVPLLVSALARNTQSPEGASSLSNALDRDHDGGILAQIPALLNNPAFGNGDGILSHMLGGKREVAESAVSQSSGLSLANTGKLFTIVAPIVMGMIGAKKRQDGFGSDILSSMLNGFANHHENDQPQTSDDGGGLLGSLGSMMGGGSGGGLLSTIGGMVAGSSGGNAGGGSGMGGFISSILDRDHDGSAIDDIGGMIGGLLTGRR